ncbi:DUF6693 family protein [Psychromonas sp. 14N.309.X.WAT.B.A12]|uniref:DUF6693 family protein n=1 Tax=unclassified Psychromonas TaxID=2614957 RepID=UPI0025B0FE0B|nr:DUF6693 family protein [Psychromonas sp. 14N.309.X.WAT.B.A12]MDN2663776.1 hypothetical protein [Psychromonas sp. 14N.309.X.WAT.B.A12]
MKIQADVGTIDILGHIILWFLLIMVTLGIAAFFYPYSFSKFVINRSELIDDQGKARKMSCNTDLFGNIGHVILWMIISILTLGLGYAFYFYKVWNYSLNNTTLSN